ncbi:MAG: serine hydrolase [Balneolaceae bacterium]|nr:serine hydrolase [Balneolaceae bacterium]
MKHAINTLLFFLLPLVALGQNNGERFVPLEQASKKTNSTGVVVIQNGETVFNYHKGASHEMMNTMSMTKSVVGLAFAKLLSDGKIDSVDIPVAHYYPEWQQGQKEDITLRHLLTHTSGLQNVASTRKEIYPSSDVLQLALCASVVDSPGTKWSYNNKAVNILSGIVKKVTGEEIDIYLEKKIFRPLDITEFDWKTDESGNHYAMSGLILKPNDMAKLGQLVLQKGSWNGQNLIVEEEINRMLSQGSSESKNYGLLWYRIPKNIKGVINEDLINEMKKAGLEEEWIEKVQAIKGTYEKESELKKAYFSQFSRAELGKFRAMIDKKDLKLANATISGPFIGYEARGYLGQTLVIYPELDLVAVRMIQDSEDYNPKTDGFGNFSDLVYKLASQN